jgi:hypothetical protein
MNVSSLSEPGLLAVIIGVFILLLGRFLTKYIERKGQNYADKNDISDITNKVEQIRNQYAMTLAGLNTSLSLVSKGLESFESEAFKSYIEFHQACSYILNDVSNIDFTGLNLKNIEFLRGYNKTVVEAYKRLRLAKAHQDLFNDNTDIREKATELFKLCINYVGKLSLLLSSVTYHIEEVDGYLKQLIELTKRKDNEELFQQIRQYHKEHSDSLDSTKIEVKNYITGDEFNLAIKAITEYQFLLRKHIKDERIRILLPSSP